MSGNNVTVIVYDEFWGGERPLQFSDIPDFGDLMSIKNFMTNVKEGGFIDYDGYGFLSDGEKECNIMISPSTAKETLEKYKDLNLTHVVWYNR